MSETVDRAILKLCAAVCESPGMLVHVAHHVVDGPLSYPVHEHADLVQFDLAVDCDGYWRVAGRQVPVRGVTAVVLPVKVPHGYELKPMAGGVGEFFTFKLQADGQLPGWPRVANQLRGVSGLAGALRRLHQYWIAPARRSPVLAAAVVQVLSLWPSDSGTTTAESLPRGIDARLERVLERIDQELHAPATLDDLAHVASLSPRQLMRRFRAVFGCSVGQYISLRRAARARQLLAAGRLNVSEVAAALGFSTLQSFSRWFRQTTGITPSEARQEDMGF